MNKATRNALTLLQKHERGTVWHRATSVDGRGKRAKVRVQHTTAYALEAQGLAVIDDGGKPYEIELTEAGKTYDFD